MKVILNTQFKKIIVICFHAVFVKEPILSRLSQKYYHQNSGIFCRGIVVHKIHTCCAKQSSVQALFCDADIPESTIM